MALLLWVVPFGSCLLLRRIHPGPPPDFSDTRNVFHLRNGTWTAGPELPGGVYGVQVSPGGAVWTIARTRGGLSRINGASWTRYGPSDFGTHTNWVRGGFALRGEEVWGATDEGVIRFDGQRWHLYTDALKTDRPLSTMAGSSGVWVIDDYGNLSHFDGSKWSIQDLSSVLPASPSHDHEDEARPGMAMTGDGRVWILWHGLWRQEGNQWREVRTDGGDLSLAYLIGQDAERVWLWLWDTNEIAAVSAAGMVGPRYGSKDLGIPERAHIKRLAVSGGRMWLATQTALLAFDGARWQDAGRPPGTVVVADVAVGPDGSAWVVGERRPLARIARWLALPLGACALALIAIGLTIAMWLRGKAENRLAADEALRQAAGHLPGLDPVAGQEEIRRQARSMQWVLPLLLVVFPFVAVAVSIAARLIGHRWPGMPGWAPYAIVLAPVALAGLAIWLWTSRRSKSGQTSAQPPQPSRYKQVLWTPAKWILYLAMFRFVFSWARLDWIDHVIPNSTAAHVVKLVVTIIVITLVVAARDILADALVRKAWRAGDYDGALKSLRRLSLGSPTTEMLRLQGVTHVLAGRPAEAEPCFRQALAKGHAAPRSTQVRCLGCLGDTLTDLGRYEEARRCLERAVEMGDRNGSARVSIAELLLAQGSEPQKALDLVDEAMRISKAPVAQRLEGIRRAIRAWALALLGRRQEAEESIEQALRAPGGTLRATLAMRHWAVGMALVALERTGKAIEHFRAARDADPKGKYGGLAMQQLKQHSVWGQ